MFPLVRDAATAPAAVAGRKYHSAPLASCGSTCTKKMIGVMSASIAAERNAYSSFEASPGALCTFLWCRLLNSYMNIIMHRPQF